MSRKEKRKAAKKQKRKQTRREAAVRLREEEEAKLNDPEEQERMRLMEQEEAERCERERRKFEESERMWLEAAAERKRRKEVEEEERRKILEELEKKEVEKENELNEDDDWEYAEGPAEIIWQGNEIIVKKKRVRIAKKDVDQHSRKEEDTERPTSNPLPPQSEAFSDHNASIISSQQLFADVSEQIPNFGTEQDKDHCPFHIKTGACRFGQRCSRVHFYPDKSCTLLIKNMYNGPGLAWEQDEGLEYTDEEVERCYEEFYEDVQTEFLKFGEIVNFKVCRNGSFHLRGNVYVHYKSLDSAVLAYHSINGRYYAGKQVTCEFVGVTRWKVAICGEYMKSRFKTCSHGTACNFIHCFRNPGGDYEWADWDKPPPRYWVKNMVALFGLTDESGYDKEVKQESMGRRRSTSNAGTVDADRYHSRRSRSRESGYSHGEYARRQFDENDAHKNVYYQRHTSDGRKRIKMHEERYEEEAHFGDNRYSRSRIHNVESDGDLLRDGTRDRERHNDHRRKSSRQREKVLESPDDYGERKNKTYDSEGDWSDREGDKSRKHGHTRKSLKHQKEAMAVMDDLGDSNNSIHEPDSDGGWSDRDGDHDGHHDHTMKRLKNRSKMSEFSNDHRNSKYRTDATDSDGDSSHRNRQGDRYHSHRRKSSRHWDEVSETADDDEDKRKRTHDTDPTGDWSDEVGERHQSKRRNCSRHWSDDHEETEKNVKDEFQGQEFDTEKPDVPRVQKHSHSSRKDGSNKEMISRADFISEDKKSNGNHEASSSDQHGRRSKSYNPDSRYHSDENIDKEGDWEPEKTRKSRREKSTSHKHHKYRDHEDYSKSKSRGGDRSIHRRHSTSLNNADSSEEYQDSENKDKRHGGKHQSSSHRRHSEKSNS